VRAFAAAMAEQRRIANHQNAPEPRRDSNHHNTGDPPHTSNQRGYEVRQERRQRRDNIGPSGQPYFPLSRLQFTNRRTIRRNNAAPHPPSAPLSRTTTGSSSQGGPPVQSNEQDALMHEPNVTPEAGPSSTPSKD
jgi:hypothetical protein